MLLVNAIFLNYSPIKTMFKNIHYVEKKLESLYFNVFQRYMRTSSGTHYILS